MIRKYWLQAFLLAGLGLAAQGCAKNLNDPCKFAGEKVGRPDLPHYRSVALEIEYPSVCTSRDPAVVGAAAPRTLKDPGNIEYWDLPLEQAMQIALANSEVIRDLGGRTLTGTTGVATILDPAIQESNPINGVEAALSAFDATVNAQSTWARTDRPSGQAFAGFLPAVTQQDAFNNTFEIGKTNATGGQTFLRNNTNYLETNSPAALFPSSWVTNVEAEFRQPLLQGAGTQFNRIAGPNATPGLFQARGVLLARTNTDLSLADFETSVRNFVSDVENAYWDLYFAYRQLDAQIAGRDAALGTWRRIQDLARFGARGGEANNEAQARNQYFQFQGQVEEAFSGRATGSTSTGGIAGGGQFAGSGGVLAREQNLRFLLGLAPNDGRLIRPAEEPPIAKVDFSWDVALGEALTRRVELRRQRWVIKQRELQLIAARNFLLPRLDAQGLYRWYGFGDQLYDSSSNAPVFDNATQTLFDGDYQEWQMGLNFSYTIGARQAWAGVRNAELNLVRDRAILETQELQIVHTLGSAFRELERSYRLAATNFNRRIAAMQEVDAVRAAVETGTSTLDVLLEAQRDQADAEVQLYRSLVEYQLAIKAIHFEKGSLLEYDGIYLQEGPWPIKAYRDAGQLAERFKTRKINYVYEKPECFAGPFPQRMIGAFGQPVAEEVGPVPAPPPAAGADDEEGRTTPVPVNGDGLPTLPTAPLPPTRGNQPNPPTNNDPTPSRLPSDNNGGGSAPAGSGTGSTSTAPIAPTLVTPSSGRTATAPPTRSSSGTPERLPAVHESPRIGFSVPSTPAPRTGFGTAAVPTRLPAPTSDAIATPGHAPAPVQAASYEATDVELPSGTPVYSGE